MKLSEIWRAVVKSQEDLCAWYAKAVKGFKPLKCRFMAICTPGGQMKLYTSLTECVAYDGVDYTIENIAMMTDDDKFAIYVYVK